jgi:hypothetical protein
VRRRKIVELDKDHDMLTVDHAGLLDHWMHIAGGGLHANIYGANGCLWYVSRPKRHKRRSRDARLMKWARRA